MPMKRLEKNLTKDLLWPYILRILKDGPCHAYILKNKVKERFGFKPGNVTAYKVLYGLNSKGYVKKEKSDRKVIYSITIKGEKLLDSSVISLKKTISLLE